MSGSPKQRSATAIQETGFVFRPEPESYNNRWGHTEGGHLLRALTGQLQAAQMRLGFVKEDGKAKWTLHDLRRYAGSVWLELGYPMEDVSELVGARKDRDDATVLCPACLSSSTLKRGREMMTKLSALHRLVPDDQAALPSPPIRHSCDIDGEATEIK